MKTHLIIATAIVSGLIAKPALAGDMNGFGVGTSAVAGQYLDVYGGVASSTSAYRMAGDSSGNYTRMGDVAPVSFANCVSGGPPGCISASQGGTTGPGFDQTFSTSNSGLIFDGGYGPWTTSASTYANLSTGKIGATGSTDYYQTAFTVARFVDTLNFNISGADASTVTNITVKFQLDGSLSTPAAHGAVGLGTPYATITDNFGFGGATGLVSFEQLAANRRYGQEFEILNTRNTQSGWVSHSWDIISPDITQFTGVYALSGASQMLGISNNLSAYASTGASFAYGSTSSLSFILPSNVTFTSASGVFLSALPPIKSAVPEPATWGMMIIGFGLVGSAMRRRQATRVSALS
jgi:PEP-CTERM motif